jgi:biopolymer transport protein ExbD
VTREVLAMPRRAGRRRGLAERADPNLIPLLDVVLQLIAFFMMLVHFGTRIEGATEAVRLPEAPAALPTSDPGLERLSVAVDSQGRLLVEDQALDPAAAAKWWADQAERRRAGLALVGAGNRPELPTLVVVRADRSASYGSVRRTLQAAQAHGFTRFTLVVLREDRR